MSEQESLERWEAQLRQAASTFRYPPTPDVVRAVKRRWAQPARSALYRQCLAWVAVVVAVIIMGLAAASPMRGKVIELFGGSVADPTPTLLMPTMTVTGLPMSTVTATPQPAATPLSMSANTVAQLVIYSPAVPKPTVYVP